MYILGIVVFYCVVGCDCMGVFVVMLLLVFGVVDEDIVIDYVCIGDNMVVIMVCIVFVMGVMWKVLGFDVDVIDKMLFLLEGLMDVLMCSLFDMLCV